MYKFRAYQDGVYFYSDQQDCDVWFEIGPDGICLVLNEQRHETCSGVAEEYWVRVHYPDIEIEQCTGLKDKNGRLIYRGDIVVLNVEFTDEHNQVFVLNDYTGVAKTLPSMGAVIKCSFYIDVNSLEEFKYENYKNIVGYRSEIIGTVNENPELLGVDNE